MSVLKDVLLSFGVAVGSLLASAPFLVIERWAGFVVLAGLTICFFLLRQRLGLPDRVRAYSVGFVIAFILLFPSTFFAEIFERGFDDGPFTGRPFDGDTSKLVPSERVTFRSGELVVYNRSSGAAPIVAYHVGDRTKWAREMFVSMREPADSRSLDSELVEITDPRVGYGLVRDRLDFVGTWTYGAEHGYAYIWKWDGIQRFYLSW